MTIRRDHVAGGVIIAAAAALFAASGDLPFGTLASPGAGMLPKILLGFLAAFGVILLLHAHQSPPLASIDWSDLGHAAPVLLVAVLATAAYTTLGFLITIPIMLFVLVFVIERKALVASLMFSIGTTALAYFVFSVLLRTPLSQGVWGF